MREKQQGGQQPQQGSSQQSSNRPTPQNNVDERDAQIKAEPDTARLRSERQSVIDGDKQQGETP